MKTETTRVPKWAFTTAIWMASATILMNGLSLLVWAYPRTVQWPAFQDVTGIIGCIFLIILAVSLRRCSVTIVVEDP